MSCVVESDAELSSDSKTEALQCPDLSESSSSDDKSVARSINESSEDVRVLLEAVPELNNTFTVMNKIGSGTFSSVYLASLKIKHSPRELFALKHLIPTSHPSRIENEIRCLKELGGRCNVVPIVACVRHLDHVIIIMPYIEHDRFQDYVQNMTVGEVQAYMYALLTAVRHVHSINVIHRDIKHSNFLCNRKLKQFALVDFGLAQRVSTLAEEPAVDSSSRLKQLSSLKDGSVPRIDAKQIQSPSMKEDKNDENLKLVSSDVGASENSATICSKYKSAAVACNLQHQSNANVSHAASSADCKVLKSVNHCPINKQKSPRRTLLTKRVLDIHRQTLTAVNAPITSRQTFVKKSGLGLNSTGQFSSGSMPKPVCRCFGRPMVCNICLARTAERAPRAGTPGYRAPEVLMKYPKQTTGKQVECSVTSPAADLKKLCQGLRRSHVSSAEEAARDPWSSASDSAYDLLKKLLDVNPFTRITAADALEHSFFIDRWT